MAGPAAFFEKWSLILAFVLIAGISIYLLSSPHTGLVTRAAVGTPVPAIESTLSIELSVPPMTFPSDVGNLFTIQVSRLGKNEYIQSVRLLVDGVRIPIPADGLVRQDGSGFIEFGSADIPLPSTYQLASGKPDEGTHLLTVQITTNRGTKEKSASFFYDVTPPIVQIIDRTNNTITLRLTDTGSGVNPILPVYAYQLSKQNYLPLDAGINCTPGPSPVDCTFTIPSGTDSTDPLVIFPHDLAGNSDSFPFVLQGNMTGEELIVLQSEAPVFLPTAYFSSGSEVPSLNDILGYSGGTVFPYERTPNPIKHIIWWAGQENNTTTLKDRYEKANSALTKALKMYYFWLKKYNHTPATMGTIHSYAVVPGNFEGLCGTTAEKYVCSLGSSVKTVFYRALPTISSSPHLKQVKYYQSYANYLSDTKGKLLPMMVDEGKNQVIWNAKSDSLNKHYQNEISPYGALWDLDLFYSSFDVVPNNAFLHKEFSPTKTTVFIQHIDRLSNSKGSYGGWANITTVQSASNLQSWTYQVPPGIFVEKSLDNWMASTYAHELGHIHGLADHYTNPEADPNNIMHGGIGVIFDEVQSSRIQSIQTSKGLMPACVGCIYSQTIYINECENPLLDTSKKGTAVHHETCSGQFSGSKSQNDFATTETTIIQYCPIDADKPRAVTEATAPAEMAAGNTIYRCGLPNEGSNACKCMPWDGTTQEIIIQPPTAAVSYYVLCDDAGKCLPYTDEWEPIDPSTGQPAGPAPTGTPIDTATPTTTAEKPKPCGIETPAPPIAPDEIPFSPIPKPTCGGECEKSSDTCTTVMNVETNNWECGCIEFTYVSPTDDLAVGEAVLPRNEDASTDTDADTGGAVPVTVENEGMA